MIVKRDCIYTPKGKNRPLHIYLPDDYATSLDRYPVLYMFDGHNVFFDSDATYGKSWGMKRFMDLSRTPMIIAAVECNHSPDHGRLKEYAPFSFDAPNYGHIEGKGPITMDWMVNVFKPMIDRRFPTIPDREHTFIAGSSMGGLMSLYAVTRWNHIFSRAAALSPHLWADREALLRLIRTAPLLPDTVVYMDWGSEEVNCGMAHDMHRTASALLDRNVAVTARVVPGGDHSEASWERQAPFFIETLMYGISV